MSANEDAPLIVVCGLEAEAKIARGPGAIVLVGGGDQQRLAAELDRSAPSAAGIVSFGVAGGILPGLRPGDIRIADVVVAPDGRRFPTHASWSEAIARILEASVGAVACVDEPLASRAGKAAAHEATGAHTVDMESHIVAEIAERHSRPFAVVRVVTDPAERTLPHAATVGMRPDGNVDLAAILGSLARRPGQLPDLIRTGLDARAAFASLLRCRQSLGPRFALLDL